MHRTPALPLSPAGPSPGARAQSAELHALLSGAGRDASAVAGGDGTGATVVQGLGGVAPGPNPHDVRQRAAQGVSGAAQALPHLDALQRAFGPAHDLGGVRVAVGGQGADACEAMGARAYAAGERIAFHGPPDLRTAAHEAAHVIQQRHGVDLPGGVGTAGDPYEQQADAVAERVAQGRSANDLLPSSSGAATHAHAHAGADGPQRQPLAQELMALLGGEAAGASGPDVQRALADDLKALFADQCPTLEVVIDKIHAAPVAERQTALFDAALRASLSNGLGDSAPQAFMALLEGSQQWINPPSNDFYTFFVTNGGSGPLPATASMNCWESILYAAHLAGKVTTSWIQTFYRTALAAPDPNVLIWSQLGWGTGLPTYPATTPSGGELLFYINSGDPYPGHVAIALGGDLAMSLWNQPNNVDTVQRIKISDLSGTVHVAPAPW